MSTTTTIVPTGTWTADTAHSTIGFSVKHLGIATVRSSFGEFEGTLEVGDDLASAKVKGSAKVDSIDTSEPQRDAHLKSADFFDAENHPELTFESTSVREIDGETFEITGKLDRSDWDMKFNQALGSGNLLVSDTVKLALDISAIKKA